MTDELEIRAREMQEEDRRQQVARQRSGRVSRVVLVAALVAVIGFVGWAAWAEKDAGHAINLIGREDTSVRVEVEGEDPMVVQRRGTLRFRPSRTGPLKFRFVAEESGESFEEVLDVPDGGGWGDDTALAVSTKEGNCFVVLDVSVWYGESESLIQIAARKQAERNGEAASADEDPGQPALLGRIRSLDRLPSGHLSRNWNLPNLVGEDDEQILTLVDVSCSELSLGDDELIDMFLLKPEATQFGS